MLIIAHAAPALLRLTFTDAVRVSGGMFTPGNFSLTPRLGYTLTEYVKKVLPESEVLGTDITRVDLVLRDYLTYRGRYLLQVTGFNTALGAPVNITAKFDAVNIGG